jgi:hypothetical protein
MRGPFAAGVVPESFAALHALTPGFYSGFQLRHVHEFGSANLPQQGRRPQQLLVFRAATQPPIKTAIQCCPMGPEPTERATSGKPTTVMGQETSRIPPISLACARGNQLHLISWASDRIVAGTVRSTAGGDDAVDHGGSGEP